MICKYFKLPYHEMYHYPRTKDSFNYRKHVAVRRVVEYFLLLESNLSAVQISKLTNSKRCNVWASFHYVEDEITNPYFNKQDITHLKHVIHDL